MFADYAEAGKYAEGLGYPLLMQRSVEAVADLPDGFLAAGFSNGGGMAEFVAVRRRVSGVLMLSGALPLETLGADAWPEETPAQIHYTRDDPLRQQEGIDKLAASIRAAGASLQMFDYPGRGHLFTDASLPEEYDADAAELLWRRVLDFCANPPPRGTALSRR